MLTGLHVVITQLATTSLSMHNFILLRISVQVQQYYLIVENGVPVYARKAYRGRKVIDPIILNLGIKWKSMVKFGIRPLYPSGKDPSIH
jgi:hypothetical protein